MSYTNQVDLSTQAKFKIVGVNPQTGTSYTILTGDMGKLVTVTNASAVSITLPQSGSAGFAADFWFWIENLGAGAVTITPTTSTIDGQASLALTQYQGIAIFGDGTNWFSIRGRSSGGDVTGPGSAVDSDFVQFNGTTGKLVKDGGISLDTDTALAASSNSRIASQHAVKVYVDTFAPGGGGSLVLKTNGVSNGSQALLDLIQGLGITITQDGSGHVTITGPFAWGGDGSDGSLTFDGTTTVLGLVPTVTSGLTLTSVAAGTGVYQGTITGGANNAFAGLTIVVTGFTNAANNGTFVCAFSTLTSITLVNFSSVVETHAGTATPSQSSYVLTRDIFATDMTVNANVFIKTANYRIFGTGTLTVNGVIENDGNSGGAGASVGNSSTGGAAGATGQCSSSTAAASGSMTVLVAGGFSVGNPTSGAGGGGGTTTGTQGTAGASLNVGTNPVQPSGTSGSTGASGGLGGTGTSGAGGAVRTGGTGTGVPTAIANTGRAPSVFLPTFITPGGAAANFVNKNGYSGGASGGSGGGGDTTNSGAGGGGGGGNGGYGGYMFIAFPTIIVGAAGRISSNGGNGAPGGNGGTRTVGNVGGGGGGAGGSGGTAGVIWLIYHLLTNNGTISVTAGTGGSGGNAGSPNGTGTNNATGGGTGVNGVVGVIIQIPC